MREPEMQDWVSKMKPEERKAYVLSPTMEAAIDRFFFHHYCQEFRRGAFARANSSMCAFLFTLISHLTRPVPWRTCVMTTVCALALISRSFLILHIDLVRLNLLCFA